jgi:preprotein translocase subunit SecF
MMAGIVVGTYSSLFIATPVMVIMHQKLADSEAANTGKSTSKSGSKKQAEAKA